MSYPSVHAYISSTGSLTPDEELVICDKAGHELSADVHGCFAFLKSKSSEAIKAAEYERLNRCASLLVAIEPLNDDRSLEEAADLCSAWLRATTELIDADKPTLKNIYHFQWTVMDVIRQWGLGRWLGADFISAAEVIIEHFIRHPEALERDEPSIVLGLIATELKHSRSKTMQEMLQKLKAHSDKRVQEVLTHERV